MKTVTRKFSSHSIFEVPETSPPQQQDVHLKFKSPCEPETTPKSQNLRSALACFPWWSWKKQYSVLHKHNLEHSLECEGSHFQALPTWRQCGHRLSSRTTSWFGKQDLGQFHQLYYSPARAKLQISFSWKKGERGQHSPVAGQL